jgi:hypothetical protein
MHKDAAVSESCKVDIVWRELLNETEKDGEVYLNYRHKRTNSLQTVLLKWQDD